MKTKLLLLVWSLCCGSAVQAQWRAPFAVINDKDGFTNVRAGTSAADKVVGRLGTNVVFEDLNLAPANEGAASDWHMVSYGKYPPGEQTFQRTGSAEEAYIHRSRIQYLSDLPQLRKRIVTKDSTVFSNDSLTLIVMTGPFKAAQHSIKKKDGVVTTIDGHEAMGIDGVLPQQLDELKSITVITRNWKTSFPQSALQSLYRINPESMYVAVGTEQTLFLVMSNGDAAGAYNAVWTLRNGLPLKLFVNRDF